MPTVGPQLAEVAQLVADPGARTSCWPNSSGRGLLTVEKRGATPVLPAGGPAGGAATAMFKELFGARI